MTPSRRFLTLACLFPACLPGGEAALRFSGGQVLSTAPLALGPHTLEAWVRVEGSLPPATGPGTIFDWDGQAGIFHSVAGIDYLVKPPGLSAVRLTAPPLAGGEWHHLAASHDGERMRILVDGKTVAARPVAGGLGGGSAPAAFGGPRSALGGGVPFGGTIDEIRLWSRGLPVEEIEERMNDHLPSILPGLAAYWDLDDGTGPTALDRAGPIPAVLGDSAGVDPRDPSWSVEVAPIRKADPRLSLGFDRQGPLSLGSGETFPVAFVLALPEPAPAGGVSAWTIAVRHDRRGLVLEEVTLAGTAAELRRSDGFAWVEVVDDGAQAGFISAVALSGTGGAVLPPGPSATLARARYRGVIAEGASARASIAFDDRLPAAARGPARNEALTGEGALRPLEGRLEVALEAPEFSLSLEPGRPTVPPGGELKAAVALTTAGNEALTGPSAWSISVTHDPSVLELIQADTSGTVIDELAGQGVFRLTEMVDNETGVGFLSAVILNLSNPLSLPPNGKAVIARARYRVREETPLETRATVEFTDGLRGSGVPVENQVNFSGGGSRPLRSGLLLRVAPPLFVRGDPNGDGRPNLSDAIFILNALFLGGEHFLCEDAGDSNDDGRLNIADPIHLLGHLFQGGPHPPLPYPQAGEDPTGDDLACESYP